LSERICICGAGAWGLAIANLLACSGHTVSLWEIDKSSAQQLAESRRAPERLSGLVLPENVHISSDISDALSGCDLAILAIPSQFLRSVVRLASKQFQSLAIVINVAKGIESSTLLRMSEVVIDESEVSPEKVITLSGPSHAEEVLLEMPTTVVAAGSAPETRERVQQLFSSSAFRVYSSDDLTGVELGGSLKNVIAISAGITDGLGFGDNTKGALITRGLAEITRLGSALGARAETFAGLSGIGDLVTTCASPHSRNRFVGEQIGRGKSLDSILSGMQAVAEGVETTRSAYQLAVGYDVEMPITTEIYKVLFEQKNPSVALGDLMGRKLKAEIWR